MISSGEQTFPRRDEVEWPIARTEYTKFFLTPSLTLEKAARRIKQAEPAILSYDAGDSSAKGLKLLEFKIRPIQSELEVTGHVLAHLAVSVDRSTSPPLEILDLDLFLTLRHFTAAGKEIPYTASARHQGLVADQHAQSQRPESLPHKLSSSPRVPINRRAACSEWGDV